MAVSHRTGSFAGLLAPAEGAAHAAKSFSREVDSREIAKISTGERDLEGERMWYPELSRPHHTRRCLFRFAHAKLASSQLEDR